MAADSVRSLEIKVGAFALASLALLAGFYFLVGNPTLGPGVRLNLDYAFTGPIKTGATVRISGVSVGKVERVEFLGARPATAGADQPVVRLHVFMEQRAQPWLTRGTRFYVTTLGVLGEHYVDVVPGPASAEALGEGETLRGVDLPRTDLLMARMARILDQVAGVLDANEVRIDELLGAAAGLMKRVDAALAGTDVGSFLADTRVTLAEARSVLGSARKVLEDPEAINAIIRDGRAMVTDGRQVMGQLKDSAPEMVQRANGTMAGVQEMLPRLDALLRALEKSGYTDEKRLGGLLQRSENVMERMDGLSARADTLLLRMEKGEGTVGKLVKDDDVYKDLKALLRDLRENPWRLMVPGDKH